MTSALPLLVIGAGPAGIAAAVEARRCGAPVLVFDESGRAGGLIAVAHEVRNLPFVQDRASGTHVADHLAEYAARWGVEIVTARVERVELDSRAVVVFTQDGNGHRGFAAVVATGTTAVHPVVDGLPHSFTPPWARSAPDAWETIRPRTAAILGGSDVAFDQARWLRARGVRVSVLCRAASPRAPEWLVSSARAEGVHVLTGVRAVAGEALPHGARLHLRSEAGAEEQTFDTVVTAVGRSPRLPEFMPAETAAQTLVCIVGDATGRRARHVVAALGDGCTAAAGLLARRFERR